MLQATHAKADLVNRGGYSSPKLSSVISSFTKLLALTARHRRHLISVVILLRRHLKSPPKRISENQHGVSTLSGHPTIHPKLECGQVLKRFGVQLRHEPLSLSHTSVHVG